MSKKITVRLKYDGYLDSGFYGTLNGFNVRRPVFSKCDEVGIIEEFSAKQAIEISTITTEDIVAVEIGSLEKLVNYLNIYLNKLSDTIKDAQKEYFKYCFSRGKKGMLELKTLMVEARKEAGMSNKQVKPFLKELDFFIEMEKRTI